MNLKRLFYVLSMLLLAAALAACNTPEAVEEAAETASEAVEEAADAVEETVEEAVEEVEEAVDEVMGEVECTDALGCVEVEEGDPINIAYMIVTSGAVAFLGEDQVGGIEIAIDDRGGELLGREIELSGEDALCSAEGGQSAAQKIAASDTVVGVIGTACSSAATAGLPIISEAGLSMISASNTAPTLTDDDQAAGGVWQPGYYRTAHNDLFQGRVAAEFAYNELGARTLATVHDGSPYADGLQAVMADVFVELGGTVTFQGAVNVGDTDMRPILTEIAADAPDVLYMPVFEPEAPLMVAQSVEISGLEDTILFGADAALVDSFPENAGAPAAGMYLSGPYVVPEGAYGDLLAKWDAKFGGAPPSGFHGHAYDAANLMMDAIEAVAEEDADGTLFIGKQAIRDYLNGVSGYDGVIGKLTCNATGDCATGEALAVFQVTEAAINDGEWPLAPVYTPGAGLIEAVMGDMGEEAMDEVAESMGECPVAVGGDYAGLSAEGQTVEWWHNHSGGRGEQLVEILADFNATNPCGIEMISNNIGGYGDISSAFNGSVAAGEVTANLMVGYQNDQAGYQLNNALVDINLLLNDEGVGLSEEEFANYYQSFFDQSIHPLFDNQRLGFAPNRSIELLHYNATYGAELGFDGPPTTPEEFVEMACAAADASESGVGGFVLRTDASAVAAWTFAFGGELLVDGGTTYDYASQATIDAMNMLQELATEGEDGKICAYFPEERYQEQVDVPARKALMGMGSSSGIPFWQGSFDDLNAESGREDAYAVAAIPYVGDEPVMNIYGGDVMIPVSTRAQELAAWEFVKWFTSPEVQARWVEASNYFPTNSGTVEFLGDYVEENPVYGTAVDLLSYGKFEPQLPSYFPVRGLASDAFTAILQGEDVADTLEQLTEDANDLEEEILAEING